MFKVTVNQNIINIGSVKIVKHPIQNIVDKILR